MTGFSWKKTSTGLRYAEAGSGPVIVVIDGAGGLRPSRAHELLAETRRILLFTLPGGSAADGAGAMAAALAGLELGEFDVMAHGAGAAVALRLALERPVRGLALLAPLALAPLPDGAAAAPLYAHPDRHSQQPAQEALEQARRLAGAFQDLAPRLKDIETPVLALFGNNDRLAPPEQGALYRTQLRDCNLMFVYGAAHLIDLDRPEAVAFICGEFFGRHDQFLVSRESGAAFP